MNKINIKKHTGPTLFGLICFFASFTASEKLFADSNEIEDQQYKISKAYLFEDFINIPGALLSASYTLHSEGGLHFADPDFQINVHFQIVQDKNVYQISTNLDMAQKNREQALITGAYYCSLSTYICRPVEVEILYKAMIVHSEKQNNDRE
jgi:hypothetical protein